MTSRVNTSPSPNSVTPQNDPIAKTVTAILKANPPITIRRVEESGDVVFSVDLQPHGIKQSDLERSAFLRTVVTADFIGEFLLYKHLSEFLALLTTTHDYDRMVKEYQHTHFGMGRQGAVLVFRFHISKIYDVINSDLAKLISTVTE